MKGIDALAIKRPTSDRRATCSGLTRVCGARQREIRRVPVTLATLLLSIPYGRAPRDATLLAGWTTRLLDLGTGRESEGESLQEARNMLGTW